MRASRFPLLIPSTIASRTCSGVSLGDNECGFAAFQLVSMQHVCHVIVGIAIAGEILAALFALAGGQQHFLSVDCRRSGLRLRLVYREGGQAILNMSAPTRSDEADGDAPIRLPDTR